VHHANAKATHSTVPSAAEYVFAGEGHRMQLFVRTIGSAKAHITVKIGKADLACNFTRHVWPHTRPAST